MLLPCGVHGGGRQPRTHTQGHAAAWEGVSPSCTQQTGVLKERLTGQRMRQGPALGSSRLLRNMLCSKRILLGGGFRRRELQTQRQRHVGRKHGFCLSCKSFPVAGGAASRMLTNGRHRGLSVIPEGRAWKPFRITASSQKGDHVRVHVPYSGSSAVAGAASESFPITESRIRCREWRAAWRRVWRGQGGEVRWWGKQRR